MSVAGGISEVAGVDTSEALSLGLGQRWFPADFRFPTIADIRSGQSSVSF
jgi:hypothetical protein